jgi:predicted CXXCH cytochrome family protein
LGGAGGRCESCHGPASKHIDAGGDVNLINGFKDAEARQSVRACLGCHSENTAMDWKGSEHAMSGVACSSCHTIHQARRAVTPLTRPLLGANPMPVRRAVAPPPRASLKKAEPELCYDCHREKRAQMNYSSHHPVREGRMTCSSCHNTHGGQSEHLLRTAESSKAFCTNCHPSKQGPFVFEHAAVEEGCNVCHQPHGTVADKLLKQNEPFICLQCHEAHFHIGRDGATTPVLSNPSGGSMNPYGSSGFRKAFGTKCTQCHSQIHGSDLPSQSITSRGKALTR